MNNDLNYPWDLDGLFIKTNKYLKNAVSLNAKKAINVQFLGGYTTNILNNWSEIFCSHYNVKIHIKESVWGPAFSQTNVMDNTDLFVCLNTSHDFVNSDGRNVINFSIKILKDYYFQLISTASKNGKHVICTFFDTQAINFPSVNNKNELNYKCYKLNSFLNDLSKKFNNITLISIDSLSRFSEKIVFSKYRDWYNFGQFLSYEGSILLAHKISRTIVSLTGGAKKVLIVDLDNTLWGGVIGDDEINNLSIGQETAEGRIYLDIQKYILQLKRRGVLLAIVSKNNYSIAKKGFLHPHSILKWSDFIIKKVNWDAKSKNIIEISKMLNLGLESFVFLDDNPSEREEVKLSLPMVTIPDCGENPEDFLAALSIMEPFNTLSSLTKEDISRNQLYKKNIYRDKFKLSSIDNSAFLKNLKIKIHIQTAKQNDVKRVCQLNNKTNQFNFTGIKFTEEEVLDKIQNKSNKVILANVSDKFGNHGITSIIFIKIEKDIAIIENWVMSCRIFGKSIEYAFFQNIFNDLISDNITTIKGNYFPTNKNTVISELYKSLNFNKLKKNTYTLTTSIFSKKNHVKHYCEIINEK